MRRIWVASLVASTLVAAGSARAADDLAPKLVAPVSALLFDGPLKSKGNGVLFMTGTPLAGFRVWQSLDTASSTRPVLPGGPPRQEWLLGYRGATLFLSTSSLAGLAGNVSALDTNTRRTSSVCRGLALFGAGTDSGFYFVDVRSALHRTDGAPGRTRLVHPGPVPQPSLLQSLNHPLTTVGRDLYFWTNDLATGTIRDTTPGTPPRR